MWERKPLFAIDSYFCTKIVFSKYFPTEYIPIPHTLQGKLSEGEWKAICNKMKEFFPRKTPLLLLIIFLCLPFFILPFLGKAIYHALTHLLYKGADKYLMAMNSFGQQFKERGFALRLERNVVARKEFLSPQFKLTYVLVVDPLVGLESAETGLITRLYRLPLSLLQIKSSTPAIIQEFLTDEDWEIIIARLRDTTALAPTKSRYGLQLWLQERLNEIFFESGLFVTAQIFDPVESSLFFERLEELSKNSLQRVVERIKATPLVGRLATTVISSPSPVLVAPSGSPPFMGPTSTYATINSPRVVAPTTTPLLVAPSGVVMPPNTILVTASPPPSPRRKKNQKERRREPKMPPPVLVQAREESPREDFTKYPPPSMAFPDSKVFLEPDSSSLVVDQNNNLAVPMTLVVGVTPQKAPVSDYPPPMPSSSFTPSGPTLKPLLVTSSGPQTTVYGLDRSFRQL